MRTISVEASISADAELGTINIDVSVPDDASDTEINDLALEAVCEEIGLEVNLEEVE